MNTKVRKKPLVKFTSHKEEMKEKGGGKEEEERKKKREKKVQTNFFFFFLEMIRNDLEMIPMIMK